MREFTIITDASCDLPPEMAEKYNIRVVPMFIYEDGVQYYNYLDGSDLSHEDFYKALGNKKISITTSAANMEHFRTVFESELLQGNDILYLGFSSALSGTYNIATKVAQQLSEQYKKRKIFTVDTKCESLGQGLFTYLVCKQRESGKTVEEVLDYAENTKLNICHWFTVNDLDHLKRGGRISGATAFIGTVFRIKPVMHSDVDGRLVNVGKAIGRKAAIKSLFKHMCETFVETEENAVFIANAGCKKDAEFLAGMIKEKYGIEAMIGNIGPAIGTHSGPGTLALFFVGNQR